MAISQTKACESKRPFYGQVTRIIVTRHLGSGVVTGAKISSYKTREQANATNSTNSVSKIQEGWSFVVAASGTTVTKAITFPDTFNSVTQFQMGVLGARSTSDPVSVADFNIGIGGEIVMPSISSLTTSGVTIQIYKTVAFNSLSVRYGFWWRAIGT